jgi:hypothetical protein
MELRMSLLGHHFKRLDDSLRVRFRASVVKHAPGIRSALPNEPAAVAVARSNDRRWMPSPRETAFAPQMAAAR